MKAEIIGVKKTKQFEYASLLIADEKLFNYELVRIWNSGVDCKKSGSAISVLLRKKVSK